MKPPFDLNKFKAKVTAALHDPRGPVDAEQPHIVTLPLPRTEDELHARWQEPQDWCRGHVDHQQGHKWSRRRDRDTGALVYSFNDVPTGVLFALTFR